VSSAVPAAPKRIAPSASPGRPGDALADVLDGLPHAVVAVDASWCVAVVNARALAVLGRARDAVLGAVLWDLLPGLDESEVGRACRRAVAGGRAEAVDGGLPGLRGWFRVHAVPGPLGRLVLHVRDVSAERRLAAQVEHLADRDALTGLANRRDVTARIADAVGEARAVAAGERHADGAARGAAVLLLDLDGFTALNAARGHDAADRLLREVAERLGRAARGGDTVARVGPDEFAVLLEGVEPDDAVATGERLLATLAAPFALGEGGDAVQVTACVGAVAVDGADDADAVLAHAGVALARARDTGAGRVARFTPALHAEVRARGEVAAALYSAVRWLVDDPASAGHGFSLAFQPVVDLGTGAPVGVEALLRWRDGVLGAVSPATFIPLAEELGLIGSLGQWVLRAACTAIAGLGAAPRGHEASAAAGDVAEQLSVAVNVSGHQLQAGGFADDVAAALAAAGLPARRLTVEVTETALVRDPRRARRVLGELRTTGVRVAIDDFGTGYSSLGYLQQLPLDVLKIDKRFVDGVARGSGPSVAIPRAVVALGGALGLRTVGEGVETAAQRDALHALGCDCGQGYLFARPLAAADLAAWLGARAWEPAVPAAAGTPALASPASGSAAAPAGRAVA
jgi:diguanylate cyclase (GGDEF)-like protein